MGTKLGHSQLKEECMLRMFEDRVLRRIFGPTRDEVTGGWRKLRNEEFSYTGQQNVTSFLSHELQ
jgi:hypothetical protein